jgi:hypothetical protein
MRHTRWHLHSPIQPHCPGRLQDPPVPERRPSERRNRTPLSQKKKTAASCQVDLEIFLTYLPQLLTIRPLVSAEHCTAAGPGLHKPIAGEPAVFLITARDSTGQQVPQGGDEFEVLAGSPVKEIQVDILIICSLTGGTGSC